MKMHFTILRCKSELDQFWSGLAAMGVRDALKCHPHLFAPNNVHFQPDNIG